MEGDPGGCGFFSMVSGFGVDLVGLGGGVWVVGAIGL
jgi:hypothetical protein